MRKVLVDDLEEGMVLAAPLTDAKGRPLLGARVVLTARHISRLKPWGIIEVAVEGEEEAEADVTASDEAAADPADSEVEREIDELLAHKFELVIENRTMAGLKLLAKKHLLAMRSSGGDE